MNKPLIANSKIKIKRESERSGGIEEEISPDDAVSASADGAKRRNILSTHFEDVSINIVLNVATSVSSQSFRALIA